MTASDHNYHTHKSLSADYNWLDEQYKFDTDKFKASFTSLNKSMTFASTASTGTIEALLGMKKAFADGSVHLGDPPVWSKTYQHVYQKAWLYDSDGNVVSRVKVEPYSKTLIFSKIPKVCTVVAVELRGQGVSPHKVSFSAMNAYPGSIVSMTMKFALGGA